MLVLFSRRFSHFYWLFIWKMLILKKGDIPLQSPTSFDHFVSRAILIGHSFDHFFLIGHTCVISLWYKCLSLWYSRNICSDILIDISRWSNGNPTIVNVISNFESRFHDYFCGIHELTRSLMWPWICTYVFKDIRTWLSNAFVTLTMIYIF